MRSQTLAVFVALTVLAACSSEGGVPVQLDEYSVEVSADVPAGDVTLRVRNVGDIEHELDVLRTNLGPSALPVKDAEVQTVTAGVELVRKTRRIRPGRSATLVVRLQRGSYVLICNVPGHYQSGMRTELRAL